MLLALALVVIAAPAPAHAQGSVQASAPQNSQENAQQKKYVFAHYMVCCPRGLIDEAGVLSGDPPVESYLEEIKEAARAGIDGFALNVGAWTTQPHYRTNSAKLFEAAKRFGDSFKLFFSADGVSADETADMIATYGDHPNQFRYDGRPVLSTFGSSADWIREVRAKVRARSAHEIYAVPFFFPPTMHTIPTADDVNALVADSADIDGYFYFGAAESPDKLDRAIRLYGEGWTRSNKLFMAGIAPYYRGLRVNYRVFDNGGYDGLVKQWTSAIANHAQWVELVTWNDWGESTYFAPLAPDSPSTRWTAEWGHLLSHDGFLNANRYFIDWFKGGKPPAIDRERLFYTYRPHYRFATGTPDPAKPAKGMPKGVRALKNQIYFLAFLQQPAELIVRTQATVQRVQLPAGMSQASARLFRGQIDMELRRNGERIASKTGEFAISPTDAWSNFNMLAGEMVFAAQSARGAGQDRPGTP